MRERNGGNCRLAIWIRMAVYSILSLDQRQTKRIGFCISTNICVSNCWVFKATRRGCFLNWKKCKFILFMASQRMRWARTLPAACNLHLAAFGPNWNNIVGPKGKEVVPPAGVFAGDCCTINPELHNSQSRATPLLLCCWFGYTLGVGTIERLWNLNGKWKSIVRTNRNYYEKC